MHMLGKKHLLFPEGSSVKSDILPQVMSLMSASVGAEDYKSENETHVCDTRRLCLRPEAQGYISCN